MELNRANKNTKNKSNNINNYIIGNVIKPKNKILIIMKNIKEDAVHLYS